MTQVTDKHDTPAPLDERALLTDLFHAAVAAADPLDALRGRLPKPPKGRTVVKIGRAHV